MNLSVLLELVGSRYARKNIIGLYIKPLDKWMLSYQITTKLRACAFLSQCAYETGGFIFFKELGDEKYFSKYEPETSLGKKLGNTEPGDGYKYRGRGLIQLTGRYNYKKYGDLIHTDLISDPDSLLDPNIGTHVSCEFWNQHNLNDLSDKCDIIGITKAINGGTNGLEKRQKYYQILLNNFKNGT